MHAQTVLLCKSSTFRSSNALDQTDLFFRRNVLRKYSLVLFRVVSFVSVTLAASLNQAHAYNGLIGQTERVVVSCYGEGDGFNGKRAADGSIFRNTSNTVAHKTLPFNTVVSFLNPVTNKKIIAVVTDRGPFVAGREFDVSCGMQKRLGYEKPTLAKLDVTILSKPTKKFVYKITN